MLKAEGDRKLSDPVLFRRQIEVKPISCEGVRHAYLDRPVSNKIFEQDEFESLLAGRLSVRKDVTVEIEVFSSTGRVTANLELASTNSADEGFQISTLNGSIDVSPESRRLGFDGAGQSLVRETKLLEYNFKVRGNFGQNTTINIVIDGIRNEWIIFTWVYVEPGLIEDMRRAWNYFTTGQYSEIDRRAAEAIALLSEQAFVNTILRGGYTVASNRYLSANEMTPCTDDLVSSGLLSLEEKEPFSFFIRQMFQHDRIIAFSSMALDEGRVSIKHPFEAGSAYSDRSWVTTGYRVGEFYAPEEGNIIVFELGGEIGILFQMSTSFDFAYFPTRGLVFGTGTLPERLIDGAIRCLSYKFDSLCDYLGRSKRGGFGALWLSRSSPYHYYYDVLPGAEVLYEAGILQNAQTLAVDDHNFWSVQDVYGLDRPTRRVRQMDVITEVYETNCFNIFVGVNRLAFPSRGNPLLTSLDQRLLARAAARSATDPIASKLNGRWPVIWVGVMSSRRAWYGQVENILTLANTLVRLLPNMALVIDGWTASETGGVNREFSGDEAVFKEILARLDPRIVVASLIGANSQTKTTVATRVTAFVANGSTASLHVDRIAKRPGVLLSSVAMRDMCVEQHVHHNSILALGEDLPRYSDQPPGMDNHLLSGYVDYRIDVNLVIAVMLEILMLKKPPKFDKDVILQS